MLKEGEKIKYEYVRILNSKMIFAPFLVQNLRFNLCSVFGWAFRLHTESSPALCEFNSFDIKTFYRRSQNEYEEEGKHKQNNHQNLNTRRSK